MGQEEDKVRILPISESLEVEDEGAEVRVGVVGRWEEVCSPQVLHLHLHLLLHLHMHLLLHLQMHLLLHLHMHLHPRQMEKAPPVDGGEGGAFRHRGRG